MTYSPSNNQVNNQTNNPANNQANYQANNLPNYQANNQANYLPNYQANNQANNQRNYNPNEQNYYSFPAYRAVVGSQTQSMIPPMNQAKTLPAPPQANFQQMAVPATPPSIPAGTPIPGVPTTLPAPPIPGLAPLEQSYIENILRFNLGKVGTFYMTYENNSQWNAKIFTGKIEAAGRDHIIISDTKTGMRYLLLMVNLDYVTFDEELKYTAPFQQGNRR